MHFDLDTFKPYNDHYGYQAGDSVIRYTARLLDEATKSPDEFLGHIGGDDFVALWRPADAEQRMRALLAKFDTGMPCHYDAAARAAGGLYAKDRAGRLCFHPIITLSAGMCHANGQLYDSTNALADTLAECKKVAKAISGSAYHLDRRRGQ